jgi:ribosomal protein S18 acetylase RimI-like enzyme
LVTSAAPIVRAGEGDAPAVASVIARAFHPLAPAVWLVPDPRERARLFPPYFRLFVEHAIRHGEVYVGAGGAAVSVWFPPSDEPPGDPEDYESRLVALVGPHLDRFRTFDAMLSKVHPCDPHYYLLFLAVDPRRQANGLGSALLRDMLARLDASGQAAYLEASDARSRRLYVREGFAPRQEPYALPDGPRLYPLWRDPRR